MMIKERLINNFRVKNDIEIPVEWPGNVDVVSLVSVVTMAANALGNGNLTPEQVNWYFGNEYGLGMISNILSHLEMSGRIKSVNFEVKAIRTSGLFAGNTSATIVDVLRKGHLIVTVLSANKWLEIFENRKPEPEDKHKAILINGYHSKKHELMLDIVETATGPQQVPYEKLEKTFEKIDVFVPKFSAYVASFGKSMGYGFTYGGLGIFSRGEK